MVIVVEVVGNAEPHPTSMRASNFSLDETLGMVDEKGTEKEGSGDFEDLNLSLSINTSKKLYRKRQVNTEEMDKINFHLKEDKERTIGKD